MLRRQSTPLILIQKAQHHRKETVLAPTQAPGQQKKTGSVVAALAEESASLTATAHGPQAAQEERAGRRGIGSVAAPLE